MAECVTGHKNQRRYNFFYRSGALNSNDSKHHLLCHILVKPPGDAQTHTLISPNNTDRGEPRLAD
ncbi:hypothetical protein Plhal710r2_c015g0067001 [Plasmopara halstedii]